MKTRLGRMLLVAIATASATIHAATIDGPSEALRIRQTTYVAGPRTAAGDIDYAAALNGHYGRGVVPDENACVALWQVLGPSEIDEWGSEEYYPALGIEPPAARGDYFVDYQQFLRARRDNAPLLFGLTTELEKTRRRAWRQDEFPNVAAWLDSQSGALAKVERAVRLPHFYNPVGPHTLSGAPGLDGYRQLADALLARSMLRAGERRFEEALSDLSSCRRLSRLMARGPNVEWYQGATIVENDAIDSEAAVLSQVVREPERLERRLAELRTMPPFPSPTEQFERFERFVVLDLLQGLARGDESSLELYGHFAADTSPERLKGAFANFDYEPALRHANEKFDRLIAAGRTADPAERRKRLEEVSDQVFGDVEDEPADGAAIGRRLTGAYLYTAPTEYLLHDRLLQANSLLCLAYRLSAYRGRQGRFPASLAELSAPAEETTDRFGGGPPVYREEAGGVLVYGIGENGADDGGRNYRDDGETDADDIRIRIAAPNSGR